MNCKNSIIGIRGVCVETTSPYLYFINDLPGITIQKAANVAGIEQGTGVNILERSIEQGINTAQRGLIQALLGVVKFGAINNSALSGAIGGGVYRSVSGAVGHNYRLNQNICRLQAMYVPYVDVLIETTANVTLKIVDNDTITQWTKQVIGGKITRFDTNYKAVTNEVTITIENAQGGALLVSDGSLLYTGSNYWNCSPCGLTCDSPMASSSSTTNDGKSNGIQVLIQTICDEDKLFCEVSKFIAEGAWYASGIWFLEELLASDRLNVYTTYSQQEAADQIIRWTVKYDAILADLKMRLPKFLLNLDRCCIDCDSSAWKYAMP